MIKRILKSLLSLSIAFLLWGMVREIQSAFSETLAAGGRPPISVICLVAAYLLFSIFLLIVLWAPRIMNPLIEIRTRFGWLCGLAAVGLAVLISWLFCASFWSNILTGSYLRGGALAVTLGVMAWLLGSQRKAAYEWNAILKACLIFGVVFIFAYQLRSVVNYPFSLSWSEGNRFWDYSVLFGRRLYDIPAEEPISVYIDLGRQSLWSLIFLLPDVSILGMRLWNVILFTIPYICLGWAILRPDAKNSGIWLLFGLWTMLFLNQGPIYTPLVLAAILVAITRRSPLWLGMLLVAAAAYYARVTRFTWLFAPAIWAGLIAFLEIAPYGVRNISQRWWRAVLLGLSGLLGGYVVAEYLLILPDTINGVDLMEFGELSAAGVSNMVNRQPLLWDRLWPNPTNPVGIVPGLLLAAAPLTALLIYLIASRRWKLNLWQILALSIGLLGFLVVGIIVSAKIGGGSNLHNLDMFLITLVMLAALALEALLVTTGKENKRPGSPSFLFLPWYGNVLILATLLISFLPTFLNAETIRFPADEEIERTLTGVQAQVDIAKEKGEVLFIDQRQLLTFGEISGVPLVQDYEKKRMMDLAMAEDAAYFEDFYQDLAAHRFSLIIVEPLTTNFQGQGFHFGNENDAWVKWVSIPLLCYYEPVELYQETGILLLQPKEEKTAPAPGLSCPQY